MTSIAAATPTSQIVTEFLTSEMTGVMTPARRSAPAIVRLAAIGTTADKPLTSPQLRRALADVDLEVAAGTPFADAEALIGHGGWDVGIVLSPYKLVTARLVDELSASAQLTGVADTAFARNGRTFGVNSNTWAVTAVLRRLIGTDPPGRVLVLGSGASTRSVLLAVQRAWPGVDTVVSARNPAAATLVAEQFGARFVSPAQVAGRDADVVINTTTWGETAESESVPFAFDLGAALRPGAAYFDLNNRRSALVEQALDGGCVVMSGTYMQRVTHACRAAGLRRWVDGT